MIKIRIKRLKRGSVLSNALLRRIICKTLESQGIAEGEINLLLADDAAIKRLNARYLNRAWPTDVLAFSMMEGERLEGSERILGDVVVSVDRAKIEAPRFNNTLKKELALYVIHGVLHLAGFRDGSKKLENAQKKILAKFFK